MTAPGHLVGEGRTADVVALDDGRVCKLFAVDTDVETVEREARHVRVAHAAGVPTPGVFDVVERDGRPGIVFERVDGTTLAERLLRRPWTVRGTARTLADLHADLHVALDRPAAESLPTTESRLRGRVEAAPGLSSATRRDALDAIDALAAPEPGRSTGDSDAGRVLCHGDFHPENVLLAAGGPTVIDWPDATGGDPAADVARTALVLDLADPVPGRVVGLPVRGLLAVLRRSYLRRYCRQTGLPRARVRAWTLPVAVARLCEDVPGECDRLHARIRSLRTDGPRA